MKRMYGYMKKLWLLKKLIVALFVGILMFICVVLLLFLNSKDTKEPVTADYNIKTGIVTFQVNPQYELKDIQLHYGDVKTPTYDANTQKILFNIFELGKGKGEFFTIQCTKKRDNDKASTSLTYEVVRGNDNVVITLYKHNTQIKFWSYSNTGT